MVRPPVNNTDNNADNMTQAAVIVWATKDIEGDASFMIPIGLQLAFAAIIGAGLFVLPESPRWCIVKGKEQQARKSLAYLMRSTPDSDIVSMEIATIIANVEHERSQGTVSYRELLWRSGDNRLPLRVWTGILFQVSGRHPGSMTALTPSAVVPATLWNQLYLLLRHDLLRQQWYFQPLHHCYRDQRRPHGVSHPRHEVRHQDPASSPCHLGVNWDDSEPTCCRFQ